MVRKCILLSLLSLSLLALPPFTNISLAAPTDGETETVPKVVLMRVLDDWERSNKELQELLTAQEEDLTTASEELENLRLALLKQKEQLQILKKDLETAQIETKSAKESLDAANKELQNTVACVKDLENKKTRIEKQRNLWQVIAAALGVIAVAK